MCPAPHITSLVYGALWGQNTLNLCSDRKSCHQGPRCARGTRACLKKWGSVSNYISAYTPPAPLIIFPRTPLKSG
jgi:hypothetical protein